ncbi:MAG: hypothetical protein WCW46_00845 [Candidatus Paceibacterota bacterium]
MSFDILAKFGLENKITSQQICVESNNLEIDTSDLLENIKILLQYIISQKSKLRNKYMGLFEWGEKRFARGIAKAMIRSYKLYKKTYPNLSEFELIKNTLSDRPGDPAKKLLNDIEDENFYQDIGGNFFEITYVLIRLEYIEYMHGTLDEEDKKRTQFLGMFS